MEAQEDNQEFEQTQTRELTWKVALRLFWIAIRLVAVIWVGQKGAHFLYQGF